MWVKMENTFEGEGTEKKKIREAIERKIKQEK